MHRHTQKRNGVRARIVRSLSLSLCFPLFISLSLSVSLLVLPLHTHRTQVVNTCQGPLQGMALGSLLQLSRGPQVRQIHVTKHVNA